MVPRTLKPGHSFTTSITLLTGLPGMGPLTSGTYVFNQPIAYTIPSKKMVAPSRAHVHVTYQVADAYGITGGASLSGTYTDPMGIPITFTYPSTWFARSVSATTDGLSEGAAISNIEEGVPSTDPGPMPDASPPLDFVRVTVFTAYGRNGPIVPDSELPLSMDNAKVSPGPENVRVLDAQVAGVPLVIAVGAGPNASQADIAAADEIVASIRPTADTASPSTSVSSSNYAFSDFEVRPSTDHSGNVVPASADVTVTQRWSTGAFPGEHQCSLTVLDASGRQIGTSDFQLMNMPSSVRHPMPVDVNGPIDGATATGSCDPARLDDPVAYSTAVTGFTLTDWGIDVEYQVTQPPVVASWQEISAQACTVAAWDESGILGSGHFTLNVPDGAYRTGVDMDSNAAQQVTKATVTCEPFAHEGTFPDPSGPSS
jgi:hypothetical protein